ncbi:MAG TPA: glycosyltransferase family 39 protein [Thermoanaerobaculia bacterium]|nr:glycosyltransferase family 39 protein [Thermoanaerobaculia bacterium]
MRLLQLTLLIAALALLACLGTVPLMDADEGRNAEVAREMAVTNDYVMPRLDGLPYLDKPIVYFAAEAAAMEVLGPTELAARLPSYLFTLATAAVLFWFARRIWPRAPEAPYLAAIMFLAMPLTIAFARTVIFDSALTFFTTVALCALYVAIEEQNRHWSIVAWAAMGFAMITKGPVTFVLVLFVAIPYAIVRKNARVLFPLLGLFVFALIITPWLYGVTQVVPEFLRYVLVTETAERMATKALKRTGPPWYFLPYLLGGALPWSLIALFSAKSIRRRDPGILYLLLWIAIPFVFFSISQSKRPQYILPLMPAIALLVAHYWSVAKTRVTAIIITILGAILLASPLFLHHAKMKPEVAAVADDTALALGAAFLIGGVLALLFAKRREFALAALALPILAIPLAATPLLHGISERRSAKGFVAELAPHLQPRTEVVGVEAFTGSMAFYLRRPITVVTEDASELTSNYLVRRYEKFTSNPASPLKRMPWLATALADRQTPRVYIVRNDDKAHRALFESRGFHVVADSVHHVAYAR